MQDENEDWLEHPVTPGHFDAPAQQDPVQQVDFDLNCVRCSYNLRSTLSTGSCPECGEPVDTSLRPDLLHMANPAWLGKLRKGMNWLITAIIINLAFIPIIFIIAIAAAASAGPSGTGDLPLAAMIVLGAIGTVMAIIYIVAAWFITEPESDLISSYPSRSVARFTILPGMGLSVVSQFFNASNQAAALTVGSVIDLASSAMLAIGFLACLWYLRRLANRIPEPSLAKQTMIVFWGNIAWIGAMFLVVLGMIVFAIVMASSTSPNAAAGAVGVMGLLMCPLLIAMLVFGIWWIVLMFRYRTRFTQAYGIAMSQSMTATPQDTY